MKNIKKVISITLAILTIILSFAGCANSNKKPTNPLKVAYLENDPFVSVDKDGNLSGFDIEVFKTAFDNYVINDTDYDGYEFIKVDSYVELSESTGPAVLIGGVQKDVEDVNQRYSWSDTIISNAILTYVSKDSEIKTYNDYGKAKIAYVGETAKNALIDNEKLLNSAKSVKEYKTIDEAFQALDSGKVNAVVLDELSANKFDNISNYSAIPNQLETVDYAFAFAKWSRLRDNFNSSFKTMLNDPDKGDILTPIAEKTFGYNSISIEPVTEKSRKK